MLTTVCVSATDFDGDLMHRKGNVTQDQTTTYAYASVSDAWVAETLGGGSAIKRTGTQFIGCVPQLHHSLSAHKQSKLKILS